MNKEGRTRLLLMRVAIVALVVWVVLLLAIFAMVLQRYLHMGKLVESIR